MKTVRLFIVAFMVTVFFSCENETTDPNSSSEDELIEAIASADKKAVTAEELPSNANSVLDNDFSESFLNLAQYAENLGYEVKMRVKKGAAAGEMEMVYFNTSGERLQKKQNEKERKAARKHQDCFEMVFPISFEMPDGSIITLETEDDHSLIHDWFNANPESEAKPALQFPVDVVLEDETVTTIANEEEMTALRTSCKDAKPRCFEFVFPVTFVLPDATEIEANNKEELHAALRDWHEANLDVEEKAVPKFPVDVVMADESTKTIASQDEFDALRQECKENAPEHKEKRKSCFDLVFPVTVIFPDETTFTAETKELLHEQSKAWHEANPDVDERPKLELPVQITYENGDVVTISTEDEMKAAHDACKGQGKQGRKG